MSAPGCMCLMVDIEFSCLTLWLFRGSMCHIAQSFSELSVIYTLRRELTIFLVLIGSIQHGSCTIQPSVIGFSSEELVDMISRCSLNRLHQFATFLSVHLKHARQNPKLLDHLRSLDTVLFSGLPLPQEDEDYAYQSGLNLIVSSLLGLCNV